MRELYYAVHGQGGPELITAVLAPWLELHAAALRDGLLPLAVYGGWRRKTYVFGDLLEQAYALSRVSDLLLLGFQPDLPPGQGAPWAHGLHLPERLPRITEDEYLAVFGRLGMSRIDVPVFDPFFHEIAVVEQEADPHAPLEVTRVLWPGLMLGKLLFSRAGVAVRAGAAHAAAGIADRSTLNEVFLRRHRDTGDGSLGWGRNSQWRTDFRRDYAVADAYHLNVDAEIDITDASCLDIDTQGLTPSEMRELLRHRCQIKPLQHGPLSADPWCGGWRLTVPKVPAA